MRFKLDENVPHQAIAGIEAAGHEAETAVAEGLGGAPDSQVLKAAIAEDRALVTLDLDFADFRRYPPAEAAGILVLRPHDQSVPQLMAALATALEVLEQEPLTGFLWIADTRRVRIRP